jgi:hypothetical protein
MATRSFLCTNLAKDQTAPPQIRSLRARKPSVVVVGEARPSW